MKRIFVLAALTVLLPASLCAKTLTIKARNLGEKDIVKVRASNEGGLVKIYEQQTFGSDSTIVVNPGDSDVEFVSIFVDTGAEPIIETIYLTDESAEVVIDPCVPSVLTFGDNVNPVALAAAKAVSDSYNVYYWNYLTRKNDASGIRGDSIPASVKAKLIQYADSVCTLFTDLPAPMKKALRQDLALSICKFWNSVSYRYNGTDWAAAEVEMKEWAALDDPYNSLSGHFPSVANEAFARALLKERSMTQEELRAIQQPEYKKMKYEYYKTNYTGKNRETLLADIIHADVTQSQFTEGIDSLAADFLAAYPESAFRPIIESDMADYRRANAAVDNPDIVFIDPAEAPTVDALIARFKGQPVLVDVWATWCGPCRESFTRIKPIQDYAREHGIVLLYISIDNDTNAVAQVRKLAGYYNLLGHHVIVSDELGPDVYKIYGNAKGYLTVPHTALYDSEGRLVNKRINAEDPDAVLSALRAL